MFTTNQTYRTKRGVGTCIFIAGHIAYLTFGNDGIAYPYNMDGTARAMPETWDVCSWG